MLAHTEFKTLLYYFRSIHIPIIYKKQLFNSQKLGSPSIVREKCVRLSSLCKQYKKITVYTWV